MQGMAAQIQRQRRRSTWRPVARRSDQKQEKADSAWDTTFTKAAARSLSQTKCRLKVRERVTGIQCTSTKEGDGPFDCLARVTGLDVRNLVTYTWSFSLFYEIEAAKCELINSPK